MVSTSSTAGTATCNATSGRELVPLVELFTSEGCDSCPPADRWLSATFPIDRAAGASVLAFHVDYWDRLGWKDRFASAQYTARQYAAMRANGATFVYTPQILVQGREVEAGGRAAAEKAVAAGRSRAPRATIAMEAQGTSVRVTATVDAAGTKNAALWLAYADSALVSDVKAGENRGARLAHDHVVRAFATGANREADGRLAASATFARPRESGTQPTVVAFVQRPATGEVLQAVALPLTDCLPP